MTLIGHRAKNHHQQLALRGADDSVDDRRTPLDLLAECAGLAGVESFDLDVAANAENAKAARWFDIEANGLALPWAGRVWCNPPYSDLRPWVEKAWAERESNPDCKSITMLLPANRTEQSWWQDLVEPALRKGSLRCYFLRGRRRFDRPGWTAPAKGDRPPFGLCVLVWGGA